MKYVFYCSHVISNTFFTSRKKKERSKCEYNPSLLTSVYILVTITSCLRLPFKHIELDAGEMA